MDDSYQEEGAEKRRSIRPLSRLWAAAAEYHHQIFWASLLAVALAGCDISLPLILRRAVDRHLMADWTILAAPTESDFSAAEAAGGIAVGGNRIFVEIPRLGEFRRQKLPGSAFGARYYAPLPAESLAEFPPTLREKIISADRFRPEVWAVPAAREPELSLRQRLILHRDDLPPLRRAAIKYALVLLTSLCGTFLLTWWLSVIAQRVMAKLRRELYEHLLRLPAAFHDRTAVGRLLTRVSGDIEALAEVFTQAVVFVLKDLVLIGGSFAVVAFLSWKLALVLTAGMPLLLALGLGFRHFARGAYRRQRAIQARLNGFIQESLTGMKVIQAFRAEGFFTGRFMNYNRENYRAGVRLMTVFAVFRPAVELVGSGLIALLLWRAAPGIFSGAITLGMMMALLLYLDLLFEPLRDLAEKYNILQSGATAAERVFGLLDEYEEDVGGGHAAPVKGDIEFEGVWFSYRKDVPQEDFVRASERAGGEWVLQDVSFKIAAGESAALVGHTGSGKTTLIALLLRYYDPQRGRILLDGIDIKRWNKRHLRRSMALVLQDVFLIEGVVADNVAFLGGGDRPGKNDPAVDELLARLPGGAQTPVGEGGRGLSAGEKQLVAAARALAQKPAVLLMDEATAAVDSTTEAALQIAVNHLTKGRSALVIAHRLSTIEHSDRILVMHGGRLAESGTHAELLARDGLYSRLHELQFKAV